MPSEKSRDSPDLVLYALFSSTTLAHQAITALDRVEKVVEGHVCPRDGSARLDLIPGGLGEGLRRAVDPSQLRPNLTARAPAVRTGIAVKRLLGESGPRAGLSDSPATAPLQVGRRIRTPPPINFNRQ